MQLIKRKKPFDPDNLQDVAERVHRMKPRSFTDKEIDNYLRLLNACPGLHGAGEAVVVLEEERSKRRT